MILTIARQLGTDERRILPVLTQQLGIPVIDRHDVEATAERLGFVQTHMDTAEDERLPASATGLRTWLTGPKHYADVLTRTVQELARTQSAILVGAAGAVILRDHPQALHIRLVARREDRIRRVSEHADVDAESTERLIEESDHHRATYHASLFGATWTDPHRYHLTLNTSMLSPVEVASFIMLAAAAMGLCQEHPVCARRCWQQVTISREFGAGGQPFSAMLADALGWPRFDHELLHQSAELSGIAVPTLIRLDEQGPGFLERLHTLQESARYFLGLREAIQRIAPQSAVVVGRGGYMLLPGDYALHLRFVANEYDRVVRTMQEHWLAEGPARVMVREQDQARAAFHRHYFHVDWADPLHYHTVINTSWVAMEPLMRLVAGFITGCRQGAAEEEEHG